MLFIQQFMRRLMSLDVMCPEQPLSWMAMFMFILPLSQSMNNNNNEGETLTSNAHALCTQNVK